MESNDNSIENLISNEDPRKKAIRYVINIGKNRYQYQSPKIRHKNKFIDTDINNDDEILFTVNQDTAGTEPFSALFYARLKNGIPEQVPQLITCYPEKMEVLSKGAIIQIRNRYGTARYSVADATLSWMQRSDSVPADSIRLGAQSVSPDGRWVCYVRKTGVATGELILKNASTFTETLLDDHADFSFERVPVAWAPDSSTVIYEKSGNIYFCDPKAAFQQVQMTEAFRKIGTGKISSVCWANAKTLIYIDHDVVYRVNTTELYTRGMYAPMVGSGVVTGRLPIAFNPLEDHFSVNEKADALVIMQGNQMLSRYKLLSKGFAYVPSVYAKPFVDSHGSTVDVQLFWANDSSALLWVDVISNEDGMRRSSIYRLTTDLQQLSYIDHPGKPVVSPDGKQIAFSAGESLYVYDVATWKNVGRLQGEKQVSYAWNGNETLYAGGISTVRQWKVGEKTAKLLFLSAAGTVCWKNGTAITARDANKETVSYDYDADKNVWQQSPAIKRPAPQYAVQNGRYRVFVGSTANHLYTNTLYVRTLSGSGENNAIFPDTAVKTPARKRVALAFDAVDSADGLSRILTVLDEYGVTGTFFVNGEFVRRYPAEAKQIAASGYECASLFFTTADLTAKGFVVDDDFIRRGLARNEDEFFAATGKELSLMWHAPQYRVTEAMKVAGAESGYRYVDCGKLSLDTQTLEQAVSNKENYFTATDIISYYAQNASNGAIIPVITGISKGSRSDYLYDALDLLITALWDAGFEIVPIRQFI